MRDNTRLGDYNSIIIAAFRTLIKGTKDMVFIKDVNHRYVGASESFVKMMGKEED